MNYHLKSLTLATLVLSLTLSVGVAESKTREILQKDSSEPTPLTAQSQTTQERKAEAARLVEVAIERYKQGQYQEALKTLQPALAITKEIGDKKLQRLTLIYIGLAYVQIGEYYQHLGEYPRALESWQQALAVAKEIGDKKLQETTLSNIRSIHSQHSQLGTQQIQKSQIRDYSRLSQLGTQQFNKSQFREALETFQQVLVLVRKVSDRKSELATLNNIGEVYSNLGQYTKSLEFFQQALTIAKQFSYKAEQGIILNTLGEVYRNLGQYAKALEFCGQALAIAKQIPNKVDEGAALNNIGSVYHNLGQFTKALESHLQVLAISKQIGNKALEESTLNNIGAVYKDQGQYAKALEFFKQALVIVKQIDNKLWESNTLNNIAAVYDSQGQYQLALASYQQALAISKQIGDKTGEGVTLSNIGETYNNLGQYPNAEKSLFAAIEVWESLRLRLTDDQKVSIFEYQAVSYRFLQQALVAQNKNNTALEIASRGKARAFVELLASKQSSNPNNQLTITAPKIKEIQQIATQQSSTLVEYSIIYAPFKVQGKEEWRESQLYIWVIKPTGEVAFKLVDLKSLNISLADLVKESRESIGVRGRGGVLVEATGQPSQKQSLQKQNLQQLYQVLIEPVASLLPTNSDDHVIFIPHESLFLVPFAALQDKDGKYLIEKHTILTSPAIQVLELTRQQRQKVKGKDVLVMGNPTMPSVGIPPQKLPPLPSAEKEAVAIATLENTTALIGSNATLAAFKQKLPTARIIHLATHGLLEGENKGIPTAIALAPSGNDNGLLTPAEIVDLPINAELVVLSACDTGRGKITGDGVIGLSRSLITAGASSVIVSLWSVPDSSTSELMTEFYQKLQPNSDKAKALRSAMLNTMKRRPNPIDWAAFTLIGEAQ